MIEILAHRAKLIVRQGLPDPLLKRIPLFRRALKSPYRFPFKELWAYDPLIGWTSPPLQVISQEDRWLLLEIGGLRFFWPNDYDVTDLPWLYHEVFTPSERNPAAYESGPIKIKPGDTVLDGGACEGFFTAYALSRGANVLAVEPVKLLCDALERTFAAEIRQGRVQVLRGCLGSSEGETRINVNSKSVCETSMGSSSGELVPVYTVDSIVERRIVTDVDLIKMDIEGAEIEALEGSKKTLTETRPDLAIAVYHELYNATLAKNLVVTAQPHYLVQFNGIYAWDGCIPRPFTLLAHAGGNLA